MQTGLHSLQALELGLYFLSFEFFFPMVLLSAVLKNWIYNGIIIMKHFILVFIETKLRPLAKRQRS